jgi:hypothetical protein
VYRLGCWAICQDYSRYGAIGEGSSPEGEIDGQPVVQTLGELTTGLK